MTSNFWLNVYIYTAAAGIILHVMRNDRAHFFRIFLTDPLSKYDISNFIMGMIMICLFSPFTIPPSIKYILTKQPHGKKEVNQQAD